MMICIQFLNRAILITLFLGVLGGTALGCDGPRKVQGASVEMIEAFARDKQMEVVTFTGYSGALYADARHMLNHASRILDRMDPSKTLINIGATEVGIGAIYELAKSKGFTTMGIVSRLAHDEQIPLSKCVDYVFFVSDNYWGGVIPGTDQLSPTSAALVQCSSSFVAIGGGQVTRDEMLAARKLGKPVIFIPAEMNHKIARENAEKRGQPEPTNYRGAAYDALAEDASR